MAHMYESSGLDPSNSIHSEIRGPQHTRSEEGPVHDDDHNGDSTIKRKVGATAFCGLI